jgi:hypothetical protein
MREGLESRSCDPVPDRRLVVFRAPVPVLLFSCSGMLGLPSCELSWVPLSLLLPHSRQRRERLRGTLFPFLRASESAIAMACFRLGRRLC